MKGKPDFYWRKSKEEGYPARSVYKLREIQEKFTLIRRGDKVLDVGAAPGSWSLYILDLLQGNGSVTGIDLNLPEGKLLSRPGYRFFQGDFTSTAMLEQLAEGGPYNTVVSDAAPSTTGSRTTDTARSLEIGEQVVGICRKALARGGNMALKIFQGGEERGILEEMKKLFTTAKAFKPKASRQDSMEIYFVGLGFKGA